MATDAATARAVLLHTVSALLEALQRDEAVRELRQLSPRDMLPGGARVVGTSYELPVAAAARLMTGLAGLVGPAPQPLLEALAAGDAEARQAVIKGTPPPPVAALYAHCSDVPMPPLAADFAGALRRLADVVETSYPPARIRKLFELIDEWYGQPETLDAMPLQRFVAQFVRNAPP
ncbi:MAG: hypothetical protein QM696_00190 [Steroidobacteraceae bacterium]